MTMTFFLFFIIFFLESFLHLSSECTHGTAEW